MVLSRSGIYFKQVGTGPAIVFLHGFLEDHSVWNSIYPEFVNAGYTCVLVDLPCHGFSRFQKDHCSMQTMADSLFGLLAELGLENPFVWGHSMGGYVGLELLRLQKIQLTLIHSNFWQDSEEKKRDRNRVIDVIGVNKERFVYEAIPGLFAESNRNRLPGEINRLKNLSIKIPANEMIAATAGMRDRRDSYDVMNTHQVSIIQGDSDTVVPVEKLDFELKAQGIVAPVYTIANCGHMSFYEQPDMLINFLRTIVIG